MTPLESSLRTIVAALTKRRVRVAVVGGLAVSILAEPRFTRDTDLAVAIASDAEAEALVRDLHTDGYRVLAAVEHERLERLATVRLVHEPSADGLVVDLLFASSGIEPEIVDGAVDLEVLPGLIVPVASVGHLLAMKLLARDDRRRPADADDIVALGAVAAAADWDVAEAAVRLIAGRGADRGRDLERAVALLRAGVSPFDLPTDQARSERTGPGSNGARRLNQILDRPAAC